RRPLQLRALRHSERLAVARRSYGLSHGDRRAAVHRLSRLRAARADGVRWPHDGGERGSSSAFERAETDRPARRLPTVAEHQRAARRVALATYERAPGLAPDDRALVPALSARGIEVCAAVWSDATVDWSAFDAVVLRSCWDYHLRFAEFRAWLD